MNLTVIQVSHNLEEAFSVADAAAILSDGQLLQVAPLRKLLRKPANTTVADFMRCENIFEAECISPAKSGGTSAEVQGVRIILPGRHESKIHFMIRPEDILVDSPGSDSANAENQIRLKVCSAADYGAFIRTRFGGSLSLTAHLSHGLSSQLHLETGKEFCLTLPTDNIHVMP